MNFRDMISVEGSVSRNFLYFRYLNRNIIGDNKAGHIEIQVFSNKLEPYNTVRSIEGYKQWEPGLVQILANRAGCFKINSDKGEVRLDLKIF